MIVKVDFLDMHIILLVLVMMGGGLSFLLSYLLIALRFVQLRNDALVLLSHLFTPGETPDQCTDQQHSDYDNEHPQCHFVLPEIGLSG